jgi:hypothetical protein
MQASINVAQRSQDTRLFKSFNGLIQKVLPALLICLVAAMAHGTSVAQTTTHPTKTATPSDAQKTFEKMKMLLGSWQGTIMGKPVNITMRLASSGTAILHEATSGSPPPDHEITMFYVDGDRLLATHYCDGGNRARLDGKMLPDEKTIEFSFLDVAGSTQGGLVKRLAFNIIDANKHVIELTFVMPNGKPVELRAEFQRTN